MNEYDDRITVITGLHNEVGNSVAYNNSKSLEKPEPFNQKRFDARQEEKKIDQDISERKSDQGLKKILLIFLCYMLAIETCCILLLGFLQGIGFIKLDEWTFRLLIAATIAQITYMLKIAVSSLFPMKE